MKLRLELRNRRTGPLLEVGKSVASSPRSRCALDQGYQQSASTTRRGNPTKAGEKPVNTSQDGGFLSQAPRFISCRLWFDSPPHVRTWIGAAPDRWLPPAAPAGGRAATPPDAPAHGVSCRWQIGPGAQKGDRMDVSRGLHPKAARQPPKARPRSRRLPEPPTKKRGPLPHQRGSGPRVYPPGRFRLLHGDCERRRGTAGRRHGQGVHLARAAGWQRGRHRPVPAELGCSDL
jgi:hypothetical protein